MNYQKLLFCFMIFYSILVVHTFSFTTIGPDEGTYLLLGLFSRDLTNFIIKNGVSNAYDFSMNYLVYYPKLSIYYPPFYYALIGLVFNFFVSEIVGKVISLLFTLGVIFFTYKLGEILFNEKVGLISAILLGIMPIIMYLAGVVMTDNPMLFFFISTFYFYIRAFKENKTKYYLLGAVSLSLGILTKWFVFPIVVILFFYLMFEKQTESMKKYVMSLFLVGFILLPYLILIYKFNIIQILWRVFFVKFTVSPTIVENIKNNPPVFSISSWVYYPRILVNQLSILFFGLSIISFTWIFLKKERNWKLILTWVFVVYVLLSLFRNKEDRYSIVYIPAFMFSCSYMFEKLPIKKKWVDIIIIFLITTQLIVTYFALPRFTYPLDELVNTVYQNSGGDVAFVSEGRIYSSSFMFKLATLDSERRIVVYRACNFFNKSETEIEKFLKENNIYYLILTNDNFGRENFEKIKDVKLEKKFDKVELYRYLGFEKKKIEICNYVCLTDEKICLKKI